MKQQLPIEVALDVELDGLVFQGGQRRHGRFGTPEEEKGGGGEGGRGKPTAGELVLAMPLWVCFTLTMLESSRNHPNS